MANTKTQLTTWQNGSQWVYDLSDPFLATDVGNLLTVTSGAGAFLGTYKIMRFLPAYATGTDGNRDMVYLSSSAAASGQSTRVTGFQGTVSPAVVDVICDGNSLTFGSGAASFQDYPLLLNQGLPATWGVRNFGVPSQTTPQMIADAASQIDSLRIAGKRQIVVAWEMTNDLHFGATPEVAFNNFANYCLARKNAGFEVVVMTILPRSPADTHASFPASRAIVNLRLRQKYADFADALVDLAFDSRIGDDGDELNLAFYANDKVHLNGSGYGLVAEAVARALTTQTEAQIRGLVRSELAARNLPPRVLAL